MQKDVNARMYVRMGVCVCTALATSAHAAICALTLTVRTESPAVTGQALWWGGAQLGRPPSLKHTGYAVIMTYILRPSQMDLGPSFISGLVRGNPTSTAS